MINEIIYILFLLFSFTIIATDIVNRKQSLKKVRVFNHINNSINRIQKEAEYRRSASGQPTRVIKI